MTSLELIDEIEELIMMHQEGPYWDFKREWYDEDLKRLKSVFGITGISRKFEVYFRKSDNFWDR